MTNLSLNQRQKMNRNQVETEKARTVIITLQINSEDCNCPGFFLLSNALFLHVNTYKDTMGMSKKHDRIDIAASGSGQAER